MRRAAGRALFAAGVLLLFVVAATYALGATHSDAARREWNDEAARRDVASARAATAHGALAPIAIGAPVARLVIPRLDLDEIVLEGVGVAELNAGPGHLPGSAQPGAAGNAIISAHRDRHFRRFDALRIGDTVRTETADGTQAWVIVERRIVDREAPALFRTREPTLTLTTCWPIRLAGPAPERLIVTAKPIPRQAG